MTSSGAVWRIARRSSCFEETGMRLLVPTAGPLNGFRMPFLGVFGSAAWFLQGLRRRLLGPTGIGRLCSGTSSLYCVVGRLIGIRTPSAFLSTLQASWRVEFFYVLEVGDHERVAPFFLLST